MPFVHALRSNASLPVEKKAVEPFDIIISLPSKFNGANVGGSGVGAAYQCGKLMRFLMSFAIIFKSARMSTSSNVGSHVDKPHIPANSQDP